MKSVTIAPYVSNQSTTRWLSTLTRTIGNKIATLNVKKYGAVFNTLAPPNRILRHDPPCHVIHASFLSGAKS